MCGKFGKIGTVVFDIRKRKDKQTDIEKRGSQYFVPILGCEVLTGLHEIVGFKTVAKSGNSILVVTAAYIDEFGWVTCSSRSCNRIFSCLWIIS